MNCFNINLYGIKVIYFLYSTVNITFGAFRKSMSFLPPAPTSAVPSFKSIITLVALLVKLKLFLVSGRKDATKKYTPFA